MLTFLLDPGNTPFVIALSVMIGLGLIEIAALLVGFDLFPDADADADLDVDVDGGEGLLAWLGVGRVPLLVVLVVFLTAFGLTGLAVRAVAPISPWIAAIPALILAFAATRAVSRVLGDALQQGETAIASDRLVGSSATIVLGATRRGTPTQAKLKDAHGQTHYVLVEPLRKEDEFGPGASVLLVERQGPKFYVVDDRPEALFGLDTRVSPEELSAEHRPKAPKDAS